MYYKKRNMSWRITLASILTLGIIGSSMAAPIKTVPWNGHIGAVSFTFDDALETQVLNLKPLLDAMPDVHVTFFLTAYQSRLYENASLFAAIANTGNEIGNHSVTHWHLTQETDTELEDDVINFADTLESILTKHGVDIQVTSFATPFCENNDYVKKFINKRHFINRDGGLDGRNYWNTEPDWMTMKAKVWTRDGTTVNEMLKALDTAANIGISNNTNPSEAQITEGSWVIFLQHDVSKDLQNIYAINPDDIRALFQRAVQNKLWAAPFGTVGAYYRAHFAFDNATMTKIDGGYSLQWDIPHKHMPKSVPLRVRLDTTRIGSKTTIEQDGKNILPESDGTYIIEFMSQSLILRNTGEVSLPKASKIKQNTKGYKFSLYDLNGKPLGMVKDFAVPENYPKGIYLIRAEANGKPTITKKVVK